LGRIGGEDSRDWQKMVFGAKNVCFSGTDLNNNLIKSTSIPLRFSHRKLVMDQLMVKPEKFIDKTWLTSKEAKTILKVSDCDLMHMRLSGELQFRKIGNRFMYLLPQNIQQDN
jgi:hypothetical protein